MKADLKLILKKLNGFFNPKNHGKFSFTQTVSLFTATAFAARFKELKILSKQHMCSTLTWF
jgi:hypothetical protein